MKKGHAEINAALRKRSGSVDIKDPLVSFFYILLRDHVTISTVEEIVRNTELEGDQMCLYSNGWLARYAEDVAKRLTPS